MIHSVRASSAPLFSSEGLGGDTATPCASTNEAGETTKKKHTPQSAGFIPHDNSVGRREFQDSKRSMDELKDFARTTAPAWTESRPVIERKSMAGLSRTDSGRRRRIFESIVDSESLPSKPLKRLLYRLNRSATTYDLTPKSVPRGSMELALRERRGDGKYMKIAFDPKLYKSGNPSTYRVNFPDLKAKKERHKGIGRKSKARTEPETETSEISGQDSHLLHDTDDYCQKVKDEYPRLIPGSEIDEPAKTVTLQASNGYSPSKGIPKSELGPNFEDSAAASLAIAQAHARKAGLISKSPERLEAQSRQREPPVPSHRDHGNRRRASSKGPYSVPIKFQMRPQRLLPPRTPRTSLDEPSKLKDTSPIVNGTAKASSTASGTDSCADDIQSEIEPGEIMNAQSAEFIHGQGTFGYHTRPSQKPPRSGPAPTRALPSLPEGHDGMSTKPFQIENNSAQAPGSQTPSGGSPESKKPKSPPKGHRYRLSPVKHNIRKDAPTALELKPSPNFTEEFPQPPRSLIPAAPDKSPEASPARRNREVDVSQIIAGLSIDAQTCNGAAVSTKSDDQCVKLEPGNDSPGARATSSPECLEAAPQKPPDSDRGNLYIPWRESRVERVKALKLRDMGHLRCRQDSATSPKATERESGVPVNAGTISHGATARKDSSQSRSSPVQNIENRIDLSDGKGHSSLGTKNAFSPIIVVADQPPCPAALEHMGPPNLKPSANSSESNPANLSHLTHPPRIANGIPHPDPYLQAPMHLPCSSHPCPNRAPTPSSFTHVGRQDPASSSSRPHSYSSLHNPSAYTAELETRIAAMEKKNLLLEKAFMAVIDASSGFSDNGISGCERRSWGQDGSSGGCARGSWGPQEVERQRGEERLGAEGQGRGRD
ncbi:MAG: hypothetical protein LQ338_002791 [Usnochroma carphineum]|nr:MAG: hypothetical protein LQ338_002791 [Usnochroma carphineum]